MGGFGKVHKPNQYIHTTLHTLTVCNTRLYSVAISTEQVNKNIFAKTLLFPVTAAASDTEAVGAATVRLNLGL